MTRIVATWYKLGQEKDYPLPNFSSNTDQETGKLYPGAIISPTGVVNQFVDVQDDHKKVARAIARDAITLLKNENNVLPLNTNSPLKVFGTDAGTNPNGINSCSDKHCNKGVLSMGWGSGSSYLPYLSTPQEAISQISQNSEFYIEKDVFPEDIQVNADDIAIVFINSDSGESYITSVEGDHGDRTISGLHAWHGGDRLVRSAAEKFSTVVVVIHTVGPVILEDWIDLPSVKSVLIAHLPGQEAGNAVTDILFGDYSPSGHLPYTIPKAESDYPWSLNIIDGSSDQIQDFFSEGPYIDYRNYFKKNIKPRYYFGHGLSYTRFSFSGPTLTGVTPLTEFPPTRQPKGPTPSYPTDIPPASEVAWPENFQKIWRYLYPYLDDPDSIKPTPSYSYPIGYDPTPKPDPRAGGSQGGNPALWDIAFRVQVNIRNEGDTAGKAVAQLYVELPESAAPAIPKFQLRQFEKTKTLNPGESQAVTLEITRKDLSIWDVQTQDWRVPASGDGTRIWVGESVGDLRVLCQVGNNSSCQTITQTDPQT